MGRVLVDTGPLVAALRRGDTRDQVWARRQIRSSQLPLLSCDVVLAEAAHFLGGPVPVLRTVSDGLIVSRFDSHSSAERLLAMTRKYADLPMVFADACLVCMAELQPGSAVLTLDARDVGVYRLSSGRRLKVITPSSE